jgi:hypothetical protein
MRKAIVFVGALMLLLVLGGATMVFLRVGPFGTVLPKLMAMTETPQTAETPKVPARNIEMGTYVIPLVQNHGIRRQIGVDMAIEVEYGASDRVHTEMARLKSAYLFALYNTIPRLANPTSPEGKQAIHNLLVSVGNGMFGTGAISKVFIKSVYVR